MSRRKGEDVDVEMPLLLPESLHAVDNVARAMLIQKHV